MLRRVCFWINLKQFLGIIFLIVTFVVYDKYGTLKFTIKMSGQVIYFCIYIYLQGFLNNFTTECRTYDELAKVLETDEDLLSDKPDKVSTTILKKKKNSRAASV